jgi:hypothetical protein
MLDIDSVLTMLARQRRIFHSEKDFQHALAWEIRQQFPAGSVRLERPLVCAGKRGHLDIAVRHKSELLASGAGARCQAGKRARSP